MKLQRRLYVTMLLFASIVLIAGAAWAQAAVTTDSSEEVFPKFPLVETSYGRLRGIQVPGKDGVAYDAFYGIPFAQPPVGSLRFAVSAFAF